MKNSSHDNQARLGYLILVFLACYCLIALPFSYSYFNASAVIYSSSKELCQTIRNEKLPASSFIHSIALAFNQFMNRGHTTDTVIYLNPACKEAN